MKINVIKDQVISDSYFSLHSITYDIISKDGKLLRYKREIYNRGNGATILLYNREKKSVVLVRQFRIATWINNNNDGQMIETCAGLLESDSSESCVRKEVIEETGFKLTKINKLFELYMSPGGVTELIHFFIAEYNDAQRIVVGGGVEDEDIEVLEIPFFLTLDMIKTGEIRDGKTVILLQYLQTSGLMN